MNDPRPHWYQDSTAVLLVAIVGLLTCQICAPYALYLVGRHERWLAMEGRVPDSYGRAARLMAIGGNVLLGIGVIVWIALAVFAVVSWRLIEV